MSKKSIVVLILALCCLLCSCGDKGNAFPSEEECGKWSKVESQYYPSDADHTLYEYYPKDLIYFYFGEHSFLLEADDGKRIYFGKEGTDSDETGSSSKSTHGYLLKTEDDIDVYDFSSPNEFGCTADDLPYEVEEHFQFAMRSQERVLITFYEEAEMIFSYSNTYNAHIGILENTEPLKSFILIRMSIKQIEITKDKVTLRGATLTADGDYSEQISADGIEVVTEPYKK